VALTIAYLLRQLLYHDLSVHTDETGFQWRTNKPEKCSGLEMGEVKDNGM
jgi:hypothetical protein